MPRSDSPTVAAEPTAEDMAIVRAALDKAEADARLDLAGLPEDAASLVRRLLAEYADGRRPHVVAEDAEVSTFQAADILNVSRPFVIKLLDEGAMPHRLVGSHRRIRFADVLAYQSGQDARSDAAMDELVAQAQELKLGY